MNGMHARPWSRLRSAIAGLRFGEHGLTTVEYVLLIAVAAVLLTAGLGFLSSKIDDRYTKTGSGPGTLTPPTPTTQCDSNYAPACVPPYPPHYDCTELRARGLALPVGVVGGDPHGLDPDGDGLGC